MCRGVKLTIRLHQLPRLRMSGHMPHTSSWRRTLIPDRYHFSFYLPDVANVQNILKVACSSKTSVPTYQTTLHHILKDHNLEVTTLQNKQVSMDTLYYIPVNTTYLQLVELLSRTGFSTCGSFGR
jgi:hypothetical protein